MIKNKGLILSMDVVERQEAIMIAEETCDSVDAIKVGYPLVLGTGISIIGELARYAPVIADFKVADIPNTNKLICEHVFNAGADSVISHGFPGRDSLSSCIETAEKFGKEVYVVAEMSHPGATEFFLPVADSIAEMAVECGAAGLVAPATRPDSLKRIRNIIGNELKIMSPGVGAQGGRASDAISSGADWIIAGRSIYKSQYPKKVAESIVAEIESVIR